MLKYASLFLLLLFSSNAQAQLVEKSYLNTDRDIYTTNDSIWIKGYVFNDQNIITDQSLAMHIMLFNAQGERIIHKRWQVDNGIVEGSILTPSTIGTYYLTATSGQMIGSSPELSFRKEIYIRNNFADEITLKATPFLTEDAQIPSVVVQAQRSEKELFANENLKVSLWSKDELLFDQTIQTDEEGFADIELKDLVPNENNYDLLVEIEDEEMLSKSALSIPISIDNKKVDLQFFPEGGHMVNGIKSKVVFKAIDMRGEPINVKGSLFDDANNKVLDFDSFYAGMGHFDLTPQLNKSYYCKINTPEAIDSMYQLPIAQHQGTVIRHLNEQGQNTIFELRSSSNELGQPLKVIVSRQTQVLEEFKLESKKRQFLRVPTGNLAAGIIKITVLDATSSPIAERLYFANADQVLNIAVKTDKESYQPREKVTATIKVLDNSGQPLVGEFNLSAIDKTRNDPKHLASPNLVSYLLLHSELKGEIPTPNFYFEKQVKSKPALDYVMLSNGWRIYQQQLLDPEAFTGRLSRKKSRKKTVKNGELTLATLSGLDTYPIEISGSGEFYVPSSYLKAKGDSFLLMSSQKDKVLNPDIQISTERETLIEQHTTQMTSFLNSSNPRPKFDIFNKAFKLSIDRFQDQTLLNSVTITERNFFGNACDALALDTEGNWVTKTAEELDMSNPDILNLLQQVSDEVIGFGPLTPQRILMDMSHPMFNRPEAASSTMMQIINYGYATDAFVSKYKHRWDLRRKSGMPIAIVDFPVPFDVFLNCEYVEPNDNRENVYPFDYYRSENFQSIDWSNIESISVNAPATAGKKPEANGTMSWLYENTVASPRPIIVIKTKDNKIIRKSRKNPYYFITTYESSPYQFYQPMYTPENKELPIPDLRETIHWESKIVTNEQGEATITWFNADRPNTIEISVEGLDIYSRVGFGQTTYQVKQRE